VRRGLQVVFAVALLAGGVVLGVLGQPLSGATILAGLFIVAAGVLLVELRSAS
jgi:hypothetical protein